MNQCLCTCSCDCIHLLENPGICSDCWEGMCSYRMPDERSPSLDEKRAQKAERK